MASTIVTKNSSTASAVPLTGDLTQGELAVNVTDKRLFTKNSGGTVVELGTNPASLALPNGTANGVAYLNGSKVVTTGSALTYNGTNLSLDAVGAGPAYLEVSQRSRFGYDGTNVFISDAGTGKDIVFTRISEQMRLTSTGLGIGTSSPVTKLQVGTVGSTGASAATNQLFGDYSTAAQLRVMFNNTGNYIGIGTDGGSNLILGTSGANAGTSPTALATLTSSGNLGIGTSSPGSKLQVQGLIRTSSSAAGIQIDRRDTSASAYTLYSSAGNLQFYNGTSDVMTLDASGNLGVGTTSPSARLHVSGGASYITGASNGTAQLQFFNNAQTTSGFQVGQGYASNTDNIAYIFNTANAAMVFGTNATERARIDSSGNFYIEVAATTASAANMFLDTTTSPSGQVKRSTSALKYKQDIRDLEEYDISTFRPVRYKSACDGDDQAVDHLGFIADWEDEAGHKELVSYGKDGEVEGFQYDRMTAILTKVVQQQQKLITQLTERITALEGK